MSSNRYEIRDMPPQVPGNILASLEEVETATIGHFRLMGFASPEIKPLKTGKSISGTAITLALPGWDSTLLHHIVSLVRPGDVLVIDRLGDKTVSCLGGGVSYALQKAGAVAAIIDGPCNDPYEIIDYDFPVWSRGISTITTRLYNTGGAFNVPVCIGGAVVQPGDAVLADDNGVVFLSPESVPDTAARAIELQQMEKSGLKSLSDERPLGALTGASDMVMATLGSPK